MQNGLHLPSEQRKERIKAILLRWSDLGRQKLRNVHEHVQGRKKVKETKSLTLKPSDAAKEKGTMLTSSNSLSMTRPNFQPLIPLLLQIPIPALKWFLIFCQVTPKSSSLFTETHPSVQGTPLLTWRGAGILLQGFTSRSSSLKEGCSHSA